MYPVLHLDHVWYGCSKKDYRRNLDRYSPVDLTNSKYYYFFGEPVWRSRRVAKEIRRRKKWELENAVPPEQPTLYDKWAHKEEKARIKSCDLNYASA